MLWPGSPSLAFVLCAAVAVLPRAARAAPFSSDSFSHCAPIAAGVSRVFIDGGEYEYGYGGSVPLGEVGYGLCRPHVEFSLRARFLTMAHFFLASPALVMRLHTRTPDGVGVEAGFGVRLGVHVLDGSPPPPRPQYDASGAGGFVAAGPDARLWLDEHWGLVVAADLSAGSAGGHSIFALAVTTGGVVRW